MSPSHLGGRLERLFALHETQPPVVHAATGIVLGLAAVFGGLAAFVAVLLALVSVF